LSKAAFWSSPRSNKWGFPDAHGSHEAPWPSSMAGTPAQKGYNEAGNNDSSRRTVELVAGWPTPQSHDDRERGNTMADHHSFPHDLPNMTTWISPQVKDWRSGQGERYLEGKHAVSLNYQATLTHGERQSGSPAGTENRGQLNPAFSRWLMGYPAEWDACADTATQSSRKPRQRS
jgi:hypothetical protein